MLAQASMSYLLSEILAQAQHPILILVQDSLLAAQLDRELAFFLPTTSTLLHFPDRETLPYDRFSPHQDLISERLATLYKMPALQQGAVITTIATLLHRLSPRSFLEAHTFLLAKGDRLDLEATRKRLTQAGYYCVNQVREHGEFAIRGSIMDIFPMGSPLPYRIDLFDNEVDSLRTFSPDNQRSLTPVEKIQLLPAKEFPLNEEAIEHFRSAWRSQFSGNPLQAPLYQDISEGISPPGIEYYLPLFFDQTAELFDYLSPDTLIVTVGDALEAAKHFWQELQHRYEERRHDHTHPLLPPEHLFLSVEEFQKRLSQYPQLELLLSEEAQALQAPSFAVEAMPALAIEQKTSLTASTLQDFMRDYSGRILFCAESIGRREILTQALGKLSIFPSFFTTWQDFLQSEKPHGLLIAPLEAGFRIQEPPLAVITETELFGKRIKQAAERKGASTETEALIRNLSELQIGDPVVHLDHGVGRYQGLHTLKVGEHLGDFLCLEYARGDKLYVPISSLDLISRYTGADPEQAPLHSLGNEQWQKAKRKAEEKARDVAAELLDIYARRAAHQGFAFHLPDEQYQQFAAAFPFEETADQKRAISEVISDMTSSRPMDRLICGDVGFGKTEVAMRAAFLAVHNGKQVAVLVPTTLLAQQHYNSFQDRFADWPIQIEVLSRFRSPQAQQKTLVKLREGKVDILIGTHKLLQKEVSFKALGLVIIDEEHLFGVHQKERLKALRSDVDILTLTATPIPRTLNMALAAIRDLSIIATPPARRLSVKTFVHETEKHLIQEAVQREILRGGQVFFVHNEVATIDKKARELHELIPEARIAVAHGQLRERELEQVMSEFYHRHFNVLVCTTIIESGIDIPTANTIIIHRADKFGLAQLHQLRGRVGRSHHQAYAYLLISSRKLITRDALKRLDALASLGELGVGFSLATHDLEIRGAGELLGEEQSGNMQEIGFSLYSDYLARAVAALKSGQEPDWQAERATTVEIDLQITALIPESYLEDVTLRLQFYKKIASAKTVRALDELQVEMIDRFGLLPAALKNLFALSELKLKLLSCGIKKLEANTKGGKIEFHEKTSIDPRHLIKLIQAQPERFRFASATELRFTLNEHELKERIVVVEGLIGELLEG